MSQDDWKFTAPIDLPETVKAIILKPMLVDGIYGLGCSPDNGVTNRVYWTIYGRKYYQEDADRLWPLLIDKVKSVMSIDWDSIQNKPKLVTQDQLDERLAKLSVPTIDWSEIQNKPDLSQYVTRDELPAQPDLSGYAKTSDIPKSMNWNQITDKPSLALTSDIPSLDGYAKLTDIPSVSGLVKETELADYAKKSDLPTMPDLSGYATVSSLIDYAKKSDLPDFTLFAKKSDIPTIPKDLVHTSDLDVYAKTSQIPTDVVTHAELTTTKWLDTGTTWLNGNTGSIQYRSITIGNYHIVEVKGSMYITTKAYAITSAFKIPLLGFEDSTTMHFSGGSTITNEIPVAFMAGDPGEAKLYTWQNVNNGWAEVHLSWTYVGGD